jgi:hypothetical protein
MNVKPDTNVSELEPDATHRRRTRIKSKKSGNAANAASLGNEAAAACENKGVFASDTVGTAAEVDGSAPGADGSTHGADGSDPRKVHELNADDFFKLGKFRI